jgi:phospholipase C
MSDNFHQSVMGGTGANHITLGTGDAAFYQDSSSGKATTPPTGQIENPDPQPGTNNFYTQDSYGKAGTTNGGSYSNCSDNSAPGVKGGFDYLNSLPHKVSSGGDCAPGVPTLPSTHPLPSRSGR